MKFNIAILAAVIGQGAVHAFNVGAPIPGSSWHPGIHRCRWLSMSAKPAAAAAGTTPAAKKRSIEVQFVQETPGGYISVVEAKNFNGVTHHRIVIGKEQIKGYSQSAGREVAAKELVSYVVKYMMDKGMSLDNTEGMIDAAVFPVNYFTLKQLTYFHEDVDEKILQLCKEAPDLSEL